MYDGRVEVRVARNDTALRLDEFPSTGVCVGLSLEKRNEADARTEVVLK